MLLSYQLAIDVLVLLAGSPNQISQLPSFDKSGEGPALHRLGHSRTRINYILPLTFSLQSINSCIYLSFIWFCWWQSFRMTICRTKMTGSPGQTRPLMCIHMMSSWWPKICQSIYWSVKGGIGCYLMALGHYTAVPVGTWWYWVGTGRYWLPVWYAFRKYMVYMV